MTFTDHVETTWHSLGTCAMKPREEGGVVDKRLNVYGTQNLKCADLSICPVSNGGTDIKAFFRLREFALG